MLHNYFFYSYFVISFQSSQFEAFMHASFQVSWWSLANWFAIIDIHVVIGLPFVRLYFSRAYFNDFRTGVFSESLMTCLNHLILLIFIKSVHGFVFVNIYTSSILTMVGHLTFIVYVLRIRLWKELIQFSLLKFNVHISLL